MDWNKLKEIELPISQFVPLYPGAQEHVYSFTPSLHVPSFIHGLPTHSSISKVVKGIHTI
jgi:hypothetical protein